jgi:hypothetical protein
MPTYKFVKRNISSIGVIIYHVSVICDPRSATTTTMPLLIKRTIEYCAANVYTSVQLNVELINC